MEVNEDSIEELFVKCELSYMMYLSLHAAMVPSEP
jgi:hypothetical protein